MNKAYAIGCIATLLVGGGFVIVSCSSSSSSGPTTTTDSGVSSDTGSKTDSGVGTDTNVADTGTVDDTGTSEGGTDCGSDPTLHPTEAGVGPFCPGFHPDGGTSSGACPSGQFCCEAKTGATPGSSCGATAADCPSTSEAVWQCDGPTMCSGSTPACCSDGVPHVRTGCTYEEIFPVTGGSTCEASCSSTQITICEADSDCGSGKTCTPMKVAGKQIGYCK